MKGKMSPVKRLFFLLLCLMSIPGFASDWKTRYEKSGYLETADYDETVSYCKRLAVLRPFLKFTDFGTSPQEFRLPLLIADKEGLFTPEEIRASGRLILLIQAGIHPGESEGRDAGMMLFRDMAVYGKYKHLLEHVSILFIPVFNVDGDHRFGPYNRINQNGPKEMGWRVTARNLNLNRDYMKARAPEMRLWLKLFHAWLPDFFIDCHTTDGADYQYVLTYGLEIFGNMDPRLTQWQKEVYLPYVKRQMGRRGILIHPYVSFRRWHDPRSGLREFAGPPMLSHGYTAIQNRPGLLIETHMLKPYKPRVESTYQMIRFTLELLNKEYAGLQILNLKADEFTASPEFRKEKLPVKFKTSDEEPVMVTFKGVAYDVETSDLTGGPWIKYHPDKPMTYELPMYNQVLPDVEVALPEAYIVPAEWTDVIENLELHGIRIIRLSKPARVRIKSYKFKNCEWRSRPFEGCHVLSSFDVDDIEEERLFPAGSAVVPTEQRTARVIAHLLEPEARDSFVYWGFFNTVFEQKEYAETYVMEKMAREMLEQDPSLKARFEKFLEENPEVRNQQWEMLNWFYMRSPYRDDRKDVYPVGKIYDLKILKTLSR